jgi:hypothetical protein
MKQIVEQLYASLGAHEKKVFWLGVIAFAVGIIMLIDVLKPPSWFGWEKTRADIVEAQNQIQYCQWRNFRSPL